MGARSPVPSSGEPEVTHRTSVGAILGTVLIPLPVAGSLVGACAGACIGAWTIELAAGRGIRRSVKPALAAGAGRLVGTLGKFIIGVAIWIVIAVAAFYP